MWLAVTHELEAPETANKAHVWEQRMQRVAAPGFPVLGDGWSSLAARDARAQASGSGHVALMVLPHQPSADSRVGGTMEGPPAAKNL